MIKNTFTRILIVLFSLFVVYLIGWFVSLEPDPTLWTQKGRISFCSGSFFVSIFLLMMNEFINANDEFDELIKRL